MNSPRSAFRQRLPVIIGIVGVLSCILAILFVAGYFLLRPTEVEAKTLVLFHAPLNGDEIEVGQVITIHATARDEDNITRIELWVDGELVEVETTSLADGISPFPLLASWQPTTSGEYTLTVRAFNSRGTRAHSSVTIEALEYPDRDEDGVTDELDACPDEAYPTRDGCPLSDDRDSDGVPDDEDDCPDEAGWADDEHAGCPTPGDSDGDGFLDEEDACPDDSGVPELEGCPDSDGDSVPDDLDEDPHEPGPPDSGGGPDFDGDTVPDDEDLAPEDPGDPGGGGAPESDAPDSDGDGARDDVDPCPHEYGEPEDGYCPPPDADPAPEGDDPVFDGPGGIIDDFEIAVNVEIEAYEFIVSGTYSDSYENVWCYVQVAEGDMQRYAFEPQGEQYWNIRAVLGGANSVRFATVWGEPLPIFVNCGQILWSHPQNRAMMIAPAMEVAGEPSLTWAHTNTPTLPVNGMAANYWPPASAPMEKPSRQNTAFAPLPARKAISRHRSWIPSPWAPLEKAPTISAGTGREPKTGSPGSNFISMVRWSTSSSHTCALWISVLIDRHVELSGNSK